MPAEERTPRKLSYTPTISSVFDDGTLIELIYDPVNRTTALAVAGAQESVRVESQFISPTGERLIPYSASNNLIANECVLLPSAVGDGGDKPILVKDVQAFLHRYVDLSPSFEEIAAHYVLLTWVYDAFNDLPYLRFRGDYGTGKTRALLTLGALCYKSFFASGASTVSPIFHIQDAFQGTLVLDEADFRFSDATAELTKVLNNGTTRGMPVLRTMTNRHRELNPTAFRVFGPKIIAMRESFADRALESRFLTEETGGRTLRSDIPIHLPDCFKTEALALRNRLLAWRFSSRMFAGPNLSRLVEGVEPRVNQTGLALLSIVDDEMARARISEAIVEEATRVIDDRSSSFEATMIETILALRRDSTMANVSVAGITEAFNRQASAGIGQSMTNKWVGNFLRRRLRLSTTKSGGVYVVPPTEYAKIDVLAQRFGVGLIAA